MTQLFCDTDGIYSSSERCQPCIVTGVFYEEHMLDRDESDEEMLKAYIQVKKVGEDCGYRVIQEASGVEGEAEVS